MSDVQITLVGDNELVARFEGMPAMLRRVIGEKMQTEIAGIRAIARTNASSNYASATVENHGPSGKLAASIQSEVTDSDTSVTGRVFSDGSVPYAAVQERGGGAGAVIVPKDASALHFIWRGKEWFLQRVVRGETPAKRYLRNALDSEGAAAIERIRAAVMEAVRS